MKRANYLDFLGALWTSSRWRRQLGARGGVIYSMDDTASHYSAMAFKGIG